MGSWMNQFKPFKELFQTGSRMERKNKNSIARGDNFLNLMVI